MKRPCCMLLMSLLLLCGVRLTAAPQRMRTRFPVLDTPIADAVFRPEGDGDCSAALQAAIDRLHAEGGGTLFLPAGRYELHQPIRLRTGVTLRGDNPPVAVVPEGSALPGRHPSLTPPDTLGTLLCLRPADRREEGRPAIEMESCGTGLRELVFWYPDQDGKTPYPWTVATVPARINDSQSIVNCRFINAWRAIRFGPHGNELHTVRRTAITALRTAIEMDTVTDIGRLDSLWLGPETWLDAPLPGRPAPAALAEALRQATGIVIHRSDWEYIRNVVISGLGTGLHFLRGVRGTTNAVMHQVLVRDGGVGLRLAELNRVGLAVQGCAFVNNDTAIETTAGFTTFAQLHSCRLVGKTDASTPLMRLNGAGTLTFSRGRQDAAGQTVQALNGRLVAVGVEAAEAVAFEAGPSLRTLRLLGGSLATSARLPDTASDAAEVVAGEPPDGLLPPELPPQTGLRTTGGGCAPGFVAETLLNVRDYGASPSLSDNGPAFRAALDAAAALRRPTVVYVPAGLYPFASDIAVPSGVELRGCQPVPFHTSAGGSVLMPVQHRGREDAPAFISLQASAGIRGIGVWYREQDHREPVPYPWTIRALGKGCWITDTNLANSWNGLDLGSVADASDHAVNYLSGAFLRRGILVANTSSGELADVQFNPHYALRRPKDFPQAYPNPVPPQRLSESIRERLEGLILDGTRNERLIGTFLYAAQDGITLRNAAQADIIMHGTDTAWRAARLSGDTHATFILAQLVPLGAQPVAAIVTDPDFTGRAVFLASQMWAGPRTASLQGPGAVILDQFNSCTGPIEAQRGTLQVSAGSFSSNLLRHLDLGEGVTAVTSLATLAARSAVRIHGGRPGVYRSCANDAMPSQPLPPQNHSAIRTDFATDFETDSPDDPFISDTIATVGGNIRASSDVTCRLVESPDAHSGRHVALLSGTPTAGKHSFAYAQIFLPRRTVMPDTILTYWIRPLNDNGSHSGLDMRFTDGTVLRDMGVRDTAGLSCHTGTPKGPIGKWTKVTVQLGQTPACGKVIDKMMLAFDTQRPIDEPFRVMVDDIRLETALPPAAWGLRLLQDSRNRITLTGIPDGMTVVYSLDGCDPTPTSPRYERPLELPAGTGRALAEFRYAYLSADGRRILPFVFSRLLMAQ